MSRLNESMGFPLITRIRLLRNGGPTVCRITRSRNRQHATATKVGLLTVSNPANVVNHRSTTSTELYSLQITLLRRLVVGAAERHRGTLLLYLFLRPALINLGVFSFYRGSV